jgi:hypothetical protein
MAPVAVGPGSVEQLGTVGVLREAALAVHAPGERPTRSPCSGRAHDAMSTTHHPASNEGRDMSSTTLTRYRVKPDHLDQHERLIEAVFAELEATDADGFTLKVFRFDDGLTHLHVVVTHDDVEVPDDLEQMPSFRVFAAGWPERCEEPPDIHGATVLGGWR